MSWIPQAPLPMKIWLSLPTDSTTRRAKSCGDQRRTSSGSGESVVESDGFHANDTWLEIHIRAMETFEATMMMFPSACSERDLPIQTESEQPP